MCVCFNVQWSTFYVATLKVEGITLNWTSRKILSLEHQREWLPDSELVSLKMFIYKVYIFNVHIIRSFRTIGSGSLLPPVESNTPFNIIEYLLLVWSIESSHFSSVDKYDMEFYLEFRVGRILRAQRLICVIIKLQSPVKKKKKRILSLFTTFPKLIRII